MNAKKYHNFGIVFNAPNEKEASADMGLVMTVNCGGFFNEIITRIEEYDQIKFYAIKIHDKDRQENGEPKREHLHAFITFKSDYTQLQALKEISEYLKIDKRLISLEATENDGYLLVQYLTHKGKPNKAQYDYKDIKTNNSELLEQLYNEVKKDRNSELLEHLTACETIEDFAKLEGVETARKFLTLFKTIREEKKQDIKSLFHELERRNHEIGILRDFLRDYEELSDLMLETLENGLKEHDKRIINLADFKKRFEELNFKMSKNY